MVIFYKTENFLVDACEKPQVCREDGGHIVIKPKKSVSDRWKLDRKRAIELMYLSMIVGEAMKKALNKRDIQVEKINFQDNGNFGIGTHHKPKMHLHLYGRSKHSKKQKRGEALYFPPKRTMFWKKLKPLNKQDIDEILKQIKIISKQRKYSKNFWKI